MWTYLLPLAFCGAASAYQVSNPSGYYTFSMDPATGRSIFDITQSYSKVFAFPTINLDLIILSNKNASDAINSTHRYSLEDSGSAQIVTPIVNKVEVQLVTMENYTMLGTMVGDNLCAEDMKNQGCKTIIEEGYTEFFVTWDYGMGGKVPNFRGSDGFIGLSPSQNPNYESLTESVVFREKLNRNSLSFTSQNLVYKFYIGFYKTDTPQTQQLKLQGLSLCKGCSQVWGTISKGFNFHGTDIGLLNGFVVSFEPAWETSRVYFKTVQLLNNFTQALLMTANEYIDPSAALAELDEVMKIYFEGKHCGWEKFQNQYFKIQFDGFNLVLPISQMLSQNNKDCVIELEMIYSQNLSSQLPDAILFLHRRALGKEGLEFHMDFVENQIAIDGYYIDTGVWPPQEKSNKTLLIAIGVGLGAMVIVGVAVVIIIRRQRKKKLAESLEKDNQSRQVSSPLIGHPVNASNQPEDAYKNVQPYTPNPELGSVDKASE
ncbi:hypothetical protein FGO68_gene14035 [Halteria grandinella]|uniref:Peptidase A1 domain-containing protein n=1 Tax=Halteria grandinella TaxID=5974 RepID=A0A8J8NSZ6_HALGN|nr:hypothetical protein FGO68_gene14035 [Halteria grandinella]